MSITNKEVQRFEELLAMSETGELQFADKRFLGMHYNPHYVREPDTVLAVAHFIHPILPNLAQLQDNPNIRFYDLFHLYKQYPELANAQSEIAGTRAILLAEKAGLVTKTNKDGYLLTHKGTELKPYNVEKPIHTGIGCLPTIIGGGLFVGLLDSLPGIESPDPLVALDFAIGMFTTSALGTAVNSLRNARHAYLSMEDSVSSSAI